MNDENLRKLSPVMLFLALIFFSINLKSQELYFCREYKNDKEIGRSTLFTFPSTGGTLSIVYKNEEAIKLKKVTLKVMRIDCGKYEFVSKQDFEVDSESAYLHFDDVRFEKDGIYRVSLMKPNNDIIVSGLVEIVHIRTK